MNNDMIGSCLAIGGSGISIVGALANNLLLSHHMAMVLWMISNPLLLIYFTGIDKKIWNNSQHMSNRALISLYLIFTISNFYGLWIS